MPYGLQPPRPPKPISNPSNPEDAMYGYIVNYTLQNDESNTFDAGPEEGTLSAPKTGIGPAN